MKGGAPSPAEAAAAVARPLVKELVHAYHHDGADEERLAPDLRVPLRGALPPTTPTRNRRIQGLRGWIQGLR
eukprot:852130-Prorocentrum_minimum.AAC.1